MQSSTQKTGDVISKHLGDLSQLEKYRKRVLKGCEKTSNSTIVIGCILRDASKYLSSFCIRLSALVALFKNYQIVLYENDSNDDTLDLLRVIEKRFPHVDLITERLKTPKFTNKGPMSRSMERTSNLALARNKVLDWVRDHQPDLDYFAVVDADLVDWDLEGFVTTFSYEDWDMVGSQSLLRWGKRIRHYDTFAFRKFGHPSPHPDSEISWTLFKRGDPLYRVDSCFGGLGVYRMESVLPFKYVGGDCEHVGLHLSMARGGKGRIYLNPSQITVHP